jgi:hypothetical protein
VFLLIALPIAAELLVLAVPIVLAWRWRRVAGIVLTLVVLSIYSLRINEILVGFENHVD